MARTVDDLMDLYRVITRPDARDTWSLAPEPDDHIRAPLGPSGLRIGVLTDLGYGVTPVDDVLRVVRDATAALGAAGAVIEEVPPPFEEDPYHALDRLFQVRARTEWESLAEELRTLVIPAVADWAAGATEFTAAQFARDTEAVMATQARLRERLSAFDFVISPVIPVVGFPAEDVGLDPARPLAHCGFTAWFNQTAQPASSVCFGMADGCPIGIQIAGRRFDDQGVLRMTKWIEDHRPFPMQWPVDLSGGFRPSVAAAEIRR